MPFLCRVCEGSGMLSSGIEPEEKCRSCKGSGTILEQDGEVESYRAKKPLKMPFTVTLQDGTTRSCTGEYLISSITAYGLDKVVKIERQPSLILTPDVTP